jgi:hypothetical protein
MATLPTTNTTDRLDLQQQRAEQGRKRVYMEILHKLAINGERVVRGAFT